MWTDLTDLGVSAPDKILRTVLVYLVLAVLLRLAGKRDLAQLNSFDLVVMLLLSNVVQNAVIGPDNSLTRGILGAVVLVAFNAVLVRVSVSSTVCTGCSREPRPCWRLGGAGMDPRRGGRVCAQRTSTRRWAARSRDVRVS
ncbi:MAG: hypothetical protein ABI873_03305 [Marmoricola sp.]